jgi:hypothetical protein
VEYAEVLARYGLDVLEGDPEELVQAIRSSGPRQSVIAVLDDWARVETDPRRRPRLLQLASRADEDDPWRHSVRLTLMQWDVKELRRLAAEGKIAKQPAQRDRQAVVPVRNSAAPTKVANSPPRMLNGSEGHTVALIVELATPQSWQTRWRIPNCGKTQVTKEQPSDSSP